MRRLLARLFNRRNLLSIITVLVGVLGLFDIPQNLGLDTDKVVIGLLSFVALESIIVNIGYLENLGDSVRRIEKKVVTPNLDEIVAPRAGRFEFADFIEDAEDVLVCGISLTGFILSQIARIRQLASRGCRVRFVVIEPDVPFLGHIDLNAPTQAGEKVVRSEIRGGLARLARVYDSLSEPARNSIEVRTYGGIPFYSGIKISAQSRTGNVIWVSFYSYGQASGERRCLLLNPVASPRTFAFYSESLEILWNGSDPIDLQDFLSSQ